MMMMMPQVMTGWLEPLLARVSSSPTTVVSPVIDAISEDTFQYTFQHYAPIGVFDWTLRFRWNTVSKREVRLEFYPSRISNFVLFSEQETCPLLGPHPHPGHCWRTVQY